ncbi:MAG: hypothetical protein IPP07_31030 [Holophagales bacterium]|nr:hypothetical protein [Holophagales bacterium]MBK9969019.1 hypothetical protein [Holophagales bacterium]
MNGADRVGDAGVGPGVSGRERSPDCALLERAIEAAGFGILALDRGSGGIAYLNAAGTEMLRVVSDLLGKDATAVFAGTVLAESREMTAAAATGGLSLSLGELVVGYSLYPTETELWVFFRDVTERHRQSSIAEALRLSDALLGVFTSLRHDLGNSVNAAKTSLDVLRRGLGRHDEKAILRYVGRALEALARMEALLGTLRDYGFAETRLVRPVPVGEVVESVVLDRGRGLADGGMTLDVDVEEGAVEVLADPASLEDALGDLVSRAASRGSGQANPGVLVRVETRRDTVAIHVSSRGRQDGAPEPTAEENDLRLLVVRRLVSQMDATFEVEGGVATVTLRRARGAD